MAETHGIVEFGAPFYNSSCELGEAPIFRLEDDTLHFVDLLSTSPEIHVLPSSSYDAKTTKAETAFGIVFVDEKNGMIQTLKLLGGKMRFNNGAVDYKGRFWAGEMDQEGSQIPLSSQSYTPKGCLWRFDAGKQ